MKEKKIVFFRMHSQYLYSSMSFSLYPGFLFRPGGLETKKIVHLPNFRQLPVHCGQNFLSSLIVLSFESHDSKMMTCLKTANSFKAKRKSWLG